MRSTFLVIAFGLVVTVLNSNARSETRVWTDRTGKHTVQAELLQVKGQIVALRLPNGKELSVRMEQLSNADRQFVQNALAANKPAGAAAVEKIPSDAGAALAAQADEPKQDFAVFDIKLGMTDREVARVLQRKGIRPADVGIGEDKTRGIKSIRVASHITSRSGSSSRNLYTDLEVDFAEDLPARPGNWVCIRVNYSKDFVDYNGVDLSPIWSKVRADVIQRFGPPSKERGNDEVLFGDENTRYLKASAPCVIELEDKELTTRLRDTYEQMKRDEEQRKALAESQTVAETIELNY
jgi:hypothetical protein